MGSYSKAGFRRADSLDTMKHLYINIASGLLSATLLLAGTVVEAAADAGGVKNTTDTAGLSLERVAQQQAAALPPVVVPLKPPTGPVVNDNLAFSYDERPELRTMTDSSAATAIEFITLPHIYFYHNGYELSQAAKDILDGAAQFIYEHDNTIKRIVINGYASDIASDTYNYRLSDRRVYAVWDYLTGLGVPQQLMSVHGWGETRPIDENWSRSGRARNRHVEIQIVKLTSR